MTIREHTIPSDPTHMTRDELLQEFATVTDQLSNAIEHLGESNLLSDEVHAQVDGVVAQGRKLVAATGSLTF